MKKKKEDKHTKTSIKTQKYLTIKIERVVKQTKVYGMPTQNETLYYLVDASYSSKRGVGFRADTPLECWYKLMQEVNLT